MTATATENLEVAPGRFVLPIRHFSPRCALHLVDALDSIAPSTVLVEGPSDFDGFDALTDPSLEAPVALHAFVRVGGTRRVFTRFTGWYPFADHSPELAALRWARRAGATMRFADLPSYVRVLRGPDRSSLDSGVLRGALSQARARDLGELLDVGLEAEREESWQTFFGRCAALGAGLRRWVGGSAKQGPPAWQDREAWMAAALRRTRKKATDPSVEMPERVVLVCGLAHVDGIRHALREKRAKPRFKKPPAGQRGLHLTAYSNAQLAELGGHWGAADPAPAYHAAVHAGRSWMELLSFAADGTRAPVAAMERAHPIPIGTSDLIEAAEFAVRLAHFRGHAAPVRADLRDAVRTTWAKGSLEEHDPVGLVDAAFVGQRVGRPPRTLEPALVQDVRRRLEAASCPTALGDEKVLRLRPMRLARDRVKAELLTQLCYLDVPLAVQESGPRYLIGEELERVEQRWKVVWTEETERTLVERSSLGPTLQTATLQALRERIAADPPGAGRAAQRIVEACALGLRDELPSMLDRLHRAIDSEPRFTEVLAALHLLWLLHRYRDGYRFGKGTEPPSSEDAPNSEPAALRPAPLAECVTRAWTRAVMLLPDLGRLDESNEEEALRGLHTLEHVSLESDASGVPSSKRGSAQTLYDRLDQLVHDFGDAPGAHVGTQALLWNRGVRPLESVLDAVRAHLLEADARPDAAGRAFDGLFAFTRRTYQDHPTLVHDLSIALRSLDARLFLAALPGLRRSHAALTPWETARLAAEVARRFGNGVRSEHPISDGGHAALSARVEDVLAQWGSWSPPPSASDLDLQPTSPATASTHDTETLLRWRLILGRFAEDALPLTALAPTGADGDARGQEAGSGRGAGLGFADGGEGGVAAGPAGQEARRLYDEPATARRLDEVLAFLYDRAYREGSRGVRSGGPGGSQLTVPRWIDELHTLFPARVCERVERAALDKYGMTEIVTNPEVLERLEPSVRLLDAVLRLKGRMQGRVIDVARKLVRTVAEDLQKRLRLEADRVFSASHGVRLAKPRGRHRDFDARRTLARNLKHYDPKRRRIVVEQPWFAVPEDPRRWRVIVCVDQSGSMLDSVVHASIVASVFTKIPRLDPRLLAFDTSVVDLSGALHDPVETLMSVQLGGGTDIARAIQHCAALVEEPRRTLIVLISDLVEGGDPAPMVGRLAGLLEDGVKVLVLASLDDRSGQPIYDRATARRLTGLGAHVAALTPEALVRYVAEVVR